MGQPLDLAYWIVPFFAGVALVPLGIQYVLLPVAERKAIQKELLSAGARLAPAPAGSETDSGGRSLRSWVVSVPAGRLQDALAARLSAKAGVALERLGTGRLLVRGRRSRYWNVNHVDPLGFAEAKVDLQGLSSGETSLTVRVDFSSYWRAILIVSLFTSLSCSFLWFSSRFRPGSLRDALIVVALGGLFLCVRYFAQRQRTGSYFDALITQAIAYPPAAPTLDDR